MGADDAPGTSCANDHDALVADISDATTPHSSSTCGSSSALAPRRLTTRPSPMGDTLDIDVLLIGKLAGPSYCEGSFKFYRKAQENKETRKGPQPMP